MYKVIPEDIQDFILAHIDSVAQLEGLLLFHAEPEQESAAADVARKLYIDKQQATELLAQLAARGFLRETPDTRYRYAPFPGGAEMVARLADCYARYLVPVTHLVHSKHRNRIQKFADAFWIRKDKD